MTVTKVYSPTQAAVGGFLGGPLASVYFIKENFGVLKREDGIKQTLVFGGIVVLIILAILPFLPENFPNMIIPIITVVSTRFIVEKYQFKKEEILTDEALAFHSNWRVFFIGVVCLIIFLVVAVGLILALDSIGIASLA